MYAFKLILLTPIICHSDMINMLKLPYIPGCCEWVHSPGDPVSVLAVSDSESGAIHLYDGHGVNIPIHSMENIHNKPVSLIKVS